MPNPTLVHLMDETTAIALVSFEMVTGLMPQQNNTLQGLTGRLSTRPVGLTREGQDVWCFGCRYSSHRNDLANMPSTVLKTALPVVPPLGKGREAEPVNNWQGDGGQERGNYTPQHSPKTGVLGVGGVRWCVVVISTQGQQTGASRKMCNHDKRGATTAVRLKNRGCSTTILRLKKTTK